MLEFVFGGRFGCLVGLHLRADEGSGAVRFAGFYYCCFSPASCVLPVGCFVRNFIAGFMDRTGQCLCVCRVVRFGDRERCSLSVVCFSLVLCSVFCSY